MNNFIKEATWTVLLFFGIILSIAYLNYGYAGMLRAISDPWNWVVLGILIIASFVYRGYRRGNEEFPNESDPGPDL